jgi:dienelactone hydrolase
MHCHQSTPVARLRLSFPLIVYGEAAYSHRAEEIESVGYWRYHQGAARDLLTNSAGAADNIVRSRTLRFVSTACALAFAACALAFPAPRSDDATTSPSVLVTYLRIPTHSAGKKGLEAVMLRPNDSAPHPLALITHGTPREPQDRATMTPMRWIPQAREFARRGWTSVIVMRRGFGDSGTGYAEDSHACSRNPDTEGATKEAVKDLRESAAYLRTRPEIDPSRMIAIGVSTGGLAIVGLSADPPEGLTAAISFAGGRGSKEADVVCNPDSLVKTFGDFGKRSKVPMLWIYSDNDHFFAPPIAHRFYEAFTKNGGNAQFIAAPPFGQDGHMLFSLRGIPIWTPMVDEFLKKQNLVLRETLLPLDVPPIEPPSYLSPKAREEFQTYLLSAPHKAFAASPGGGFGVAVGHRTTDEAAQEALSVCAKFASKGNTCALIMRDDTKVQP